MMVLVDTSIWSLALRRDTAQLNDAQQRRIEDLRALIEEGRVLMIGLIRQELLTGVRSRRTFLEIRDSLRAFRDEPLGLEDYEKAAELANLCRSKGVAGSPVDFLICAVALLRKAAILTDDGDFIHFSQVIPIRLYH